MGAKARKKTKKQPDADKRVSNTPNTLWKELLTGGAAVWKEDLEDNMGALGKTVNFLVWIVIIIAAPVAIHLLGWVLFTLSEMVGV